MSFLQLQIMGYNADLYDNYTVALTSPHGIIVVSVMLQIGQLSNPELRRITDAAVNIKYGGLMTKRTIINLKLFLQLLVSYV